jgi:endo-1,4-beta-xylanase
LIFIRDITYTATYTPSGDSYLSVYGWFTSPLVEYYIVEDWSGYNPSSTGTYKGTITSDGSIYDIYLNVRTDASSIEGTATFNQYWSIRQSYGESLWCVGEVGIGDRDVQLSDCGRGGV